MTVQLPVYNADGCLPSRANDCDPGPYVKIEGRMVCLRCARAAKDPRVAKERGDA